MEVLTSKVALGIATGVCGTLFLGYCIYFDYQRHSDPDFKKKLHERRQAKKLAASSNKRATVFPNMRDQEAVQRFFLQEIQLGEELLAAGDVENGVEHIGNAVVVCGQPNDLLNLLQQTLQPQAFHLLIERLPSIPSRMARAAPGVVPEDDVE